MNNSYFNPDNKPMIACQEVLLKARVYYVPMSTIWDKLDKEYLNKYFKLKQTSSVLDKEEDIHEIEFAFHCKVGLDNTLYRRLLVKTIFGDTSLPPGDLIKTVFDDEFLYLTYI